MDKTLAKQKDEILFVKIDNDGYDLGAQRREIKGSDIPEIIKIIKDYQNGIDISDSALVTIASKKDIAQQDYILVGERYKGAVVVNSSYPMVKLGEVCEIIRGITFGKKDQLQEATENSIKVATTKAAQEFGIVEEDLYNIPKDFIKDTSKLLKNGDILISTANSLNLLGRTTYVSNLSYKISFGAFMTLIRGNTEKVNTLYLLHCLKTGQALQYFKNNANTTTNISNLSYSSLSTFKIPLPPLHIQEEIVKEIEGYQKVIDGAKQVVENYKPTIRMDPSWEIKLLEDIVTIRTGKIDANCAEANGKYPFFTCAKEPYYINEYAFDCEALMLAGNNATADYDVKHYKGKFNAYQRTYVITINNTDVVKYEYLKTIMENNLGNLKRNSIGSQTKYLTLGVIKSLKIPLPALSVQQQIVEQINEEMVIVEQNKRLIEIFEQKIKDKISEVWGD